MTVTEVFSSSSSSASSASGVSSLSQSSSSSSSSYNSIISFVVPDQKAKQKLNASLLKLVVTQALPLTLVETSEFRDFVTNVNCSSTIPTWTAKSVWDAARTTYLFTQSNVLTRLADFPPGSVAIRRV